jgi:hypothetical protein
MSVLKDHLLKAPEEHLAKSVKPLIEKWDHQETALQVLEVLDLCIHGALASTFVIQILQSLYDAALNNECTSHDETIEFALWRTEP